MRVLLNADAVGGVFTYALALAHGLSESGAEVTLVLQGPPPSDSQRAALAGIPGLRVIETDLALEWQDFRGTDTARARRMLEIVAHDVRPDIVHLNSFREAKADFGCPVLVMAHSDVGSWWRSCRGSAPDSDWDGYCADVKAGLDAADFWAAPSRWYQDTVEALYEPRTAGHVVPNGLAETGEWGSKRPIVLAAGRLWDEAKDIRTVVEAAGQSRWPVEIAGALRAEAPEVRSVHWLGELAHRDLLSKMSQAGVFVSAAVYEPFGLAALEAASCGCALALSDIPTHRELWDGAALFFAPREAADLARQLNRLADDDALRATLQRRAKNRARGYSAQRTTEATVALYRRAMAQPPSRATRPVLAELSA